ncbi:repeat-containing protein [Nitrosomonas marina]|uniref:Repeat-containing protein n=1 Tax=Nitrosomonas marina TaxID=917 RepID=A0A1I0CSS7_9PROT|nr:SwmB domain-containing protein [Nitrosomonas marina]SET22799.1 repeat-containing protein [Nitrosomonas marina]
MATQQNDVINVQRGNQAGVGGDDTYILSPALIDADAEITISDTQGANKIQLIGGLEITSSVVANDTAQLTLSNGAVITVLGASSFTFEIGGNPLTGTPGTSSDYSGFVTDTLGTTVPGEGEDPSNGGAVTIPPDTPPVDETAPEFSSAAADGTSVVLTYNESLDDNSIPALGDFEVLVGGSAATISSVSVSGSEVTLTLDAPVKSTDTLTVAYTQPASNRVQDDAGNDAASLSATEVTNNTELTFTLTPSVENGTEGTDVTYTVTASEELASDTDVVFTVSPGDSTAADQGTNTTNLNDFATGTFNPQTVTIAAGSTTATFAVAAKSDGLTELPEMYTVTAEVNGTTLEEETTVNDGTSGGGDVFALTAATDVYNGSGNNDSIIGDITAGGLTVNAADQINGAGGTDTFTIFGSGFTLSGATPSPTGVITNTENLIIDHVADADQNFSSLTKAATGIEKIAINNASALSAAAGRTITTTTDQTLQLATGPTNGAAGAFPTTWAGPNDAALNLHLNGYQGAATPQALTITGGASTQTLNIMSNGATNAISTLTGPATVRDHVVGGSQQITYALAAADAAALNNVNAGTSSGGVNVNATAATTKAGFTFTGGSGNDAITFADDNLGVLTAGSQLDGGAGTADKLGISDTVISANELTKINAAQNFEVLGLNADITIDGSSLTTIKSFAIDTAALTNTISNIATGAKISLNASSTAQTYSSAVGVNDLAIDLNNGTTATALTVGQTDVTLTSNGTAGVTTNTITTLSNADNSVYDISGNSNLTITNATAATATGSKFDAADLTGALTIIGNQTAFAAGSGLGDILIGGSNNDSIQSSVNGATMTGNGGTDTFIVTTALGGTSTTLLAPTITDFTLGETISLAAGNGISEFTAAKVDVSGAANLAAALDIAAAGDGGTNTIVDWFQFGGNTYLVQDNTAGNTFAATDIAVKLTGQLDLSTSTFTDGAPDTLLFT